MRDRLTSLKFFRNMRNLFFCLFVVSLAEAVILLFDIFLWKHRYLFSAITLLAASLIMGFLSYYFHRRFRLRE
jgi:hypothetical protein